MVGTSEHNQQKTNSVVPVEQNINHNVVTEDLFNTKWPIIGKPIKIYKETSADEFDARQKESTENLTAKIN